MPTDEMIWGDQSDWYNPGNYQTGTKEENKLLCGSFGAAPTRYEKGSLGNGLYHDVLPHTAFAIQKQIDESISYCGLGNESVWSRIKYSLGNKGTFGTFDKEDNRAVTNFAIPYKLSERNGLWQTNMTSGGASAGQTTNGNRCRWSPQGFDNFDFTSATTATNSNANFNRTVTPYVSIPVRNFILFPVLRVASGMNENEGSTGYSNTQTVSLQKYVDLQNTVNYNTHPYIIGVSAQPYAFMQDVEDIDEVTGEGIGANANRDRTTLTNLMPYGLSVLSPLSYAMDAPVDVSNPTETLQDVYNYSCFKSSSTLTGIPLFGVYDNRSSLTPLMGQISMSANPTLQMIWFLPHESAVYREKSNGTSGRYGYYYLEYYNGFVDWVRQQIACFGLFFTEDEATVKRGALNDPLMMLGVLDSNGVGHGNWTAGTANEQQAQWQWDTTNKSSYKPSGGGGGDDPNAYDGSMHTGSLLTFGTATTRYNVAAVSVDLGLLPQLWDIMALADPDEAIDGYCLNTFLTNNPIDAIVSLQYLPISENMGNGSTTIKLGNYDTKIDATFAKTSLLFDCGTYEIFPRFGDNWIDRETKITLYLPFCGVVDLDPETYMGRSVNVEYGIDLTTGACSAYVSFSDDRGKRVITDVANGVCAIDLPVTGLQQQTLNSQLFNASENTKQLKVNNAFKGFKSIMGAASNLNGSPDAAINSLLGSAADIYNIFQSEKIADYNLQHTMIPTKMIGTSSGLTGSMCELYPTIIFSRPVANNTSDWSNFSEYAHSVGYACCISGQLSDFSGYTEISSIDLTGFEATATEKNMIRAALAGGVYL